MSESDARISIADQPQKRENATLLALTALGIVFGDIGTSPLYALRECFMGHAGMAMTRANVLGVVSTLLWTLVCVVCVKYVIFVMRADNRGEGGILALITLASSTLAALQIKKAGLFVVLGILGAALLYSDGIITPAITVLGAVEGLTEVTPFFRPFIIPISLGILICLFIFQSRGTAQVGALFGPILMVWFISLALLGILAIVKAPAILGALNPLYAVAFLFHDSKTSFAVLGSVFLALTGAEMMFADLGHFGRKPIRISWFSVVFPCLVLNYLGQGAFLLSMPPSAENLFFRIVPPALMYPMVALSTVAAVIASQAVISGAYSLTRQAVQLGFWPRLQVRHTSAKKIGQVYVPFVNWALMVGVITLVLVFRRSGNLAAAYGIAVSVDMLITTVLIVLIARSKWAAPWWLIAVPAVAFLCIDGSFFVSNILKVQHGGWIVLVIACLLGIFMKTWMDGRKILRANMLANALDLTAFIQNIQQNPPQRVSGTAVFLAGNPNGVPGALLHNLKHNKVMHEHTIILSVKTEEIPFVSQENRVNIDYLGGGMYRILASYGFSETADIPALLAGIKFSDLRFDPLQTTFFLGREALVVSKNRRMLTWRKRVFLYMSHNSLNATSFFRLPPNRVVELGSQIEL